MRPAVYIPTYNARHLLGPVLRSLAEQTRPVDVVIVDNGSSDSSAEFIRAEFPEVTVLELKRNFGFGPAINHAVEAHPGDPVILVNNDAQYHPDFVAEMLGALASDVQMVAGVLLQESDPELIDSAGVVADRTLMGFDYLKGESIDVLESALPPLGPTGGAALYRHQAFASVRGFDERIFLYYEDLDLALRLRHGGARCGLATAARALHAYSASLGASSGSKYARTGWGRGYMLRRYGVMSRPRAAARVLACEGAICAGQLLRDHTAKGLSGRLQGWRDGAGLERRDPVGAPLLDISMWEALRLRGRRRSA
ncbi:MAG: glycosyltransferase family 2 protein [Solirubrobacterales bacterium]